MGGILRPREHARETCRAYLRGELDFLFIAPERLRVPGFPELLERRPPALIAVDDVSSYGVVPTDEKGRVKLSMKALIEREPQAPATQE